MQESTAKLRALLTLANVVSPARASSTHAAFATISVAGTTHSGAQGLLSSDAAIPDGVLLHPHDSTEALSWARALRADERFSLLPIYSTRAFEGDFAQLTDGVFDTPGAMFARVYDFKQRIAMLPARDHLTCDERLLEFLFLRPDRTITPVSDWSSASIYRHPLLEVFAPPATTVDQWLSNLRRRDLLEPLALIDRTRACSACGGAHLNFVDVCPNCSSIDIAETIFLHCHTCGGVAKQDDYLSREGLGCPKCMTRLRHIGVDYDRALEAFTCAACEGRFTEPDVKARCLHCHTLCRTEDLQEHRIESFRLSDAGQLAARTGHLGELFALIDKFQCVHPAYFEQTLDFMLSLGQRHREIEFGLVCLQFANVRELLTRLPRVQVTQLIDGFAVRLRELVRTTDLVMREDDDHCWLLLPQTPPAGLQVLLSRVKAIPETADPTLFGRLEIAVEAVSSRNLDKQTPGAKLLMAQIRSRLP
jgi:hypothetical protein